MDFRILGANISVRLALAVAAVLVGLSAGVALLSRSGEPHATWPALGAPAGNGLIAYSSDGDIVVGDPVTGTSTAIVTGLGNDTRPIFSPDGLLIAFLRGESAQDATIVVVRADGSDERVVFAEGCRYFFPQHAWTPDSTSILVDHCSDQRPDWDVLLSLADASGVAEPRLITPPLQTTPGYTYFSSYEEVAPMFRPPNGEQIVGVVDGVFSLVDVNGTRIGGFAPTSLPNPVFTIDRAAWSRDGSMLVFGLVFGPTTEGGTYVLNADGSVLRRFENVSNHRAWSPDGSQIAYMKATQAPAGSVIAILDVETGAERVLEATSAVEKDMADPATDPDAFRTYSIRNGHRYTHEGWSWTPDGRGIVVLERHGTRPFVVDIETGNVTEFPWEIDGAPSWQRVPIN